MIGLEKYTVEELEAIKENTNEAGDADGVIILQGIIDTRKADEYAHQAENEAYPDSTGTLT